MFRDKLHKLIQDHENLKKSRSKQSKAASLARKQFLQSSLKVMWIAKAKIRDILKKEPNMDKDRLKMDMEFLQEQKKTRKMTLGSRDTAYEARAAKRFERKRKF